MKIALPVLGLVFGLSLLANAQDLPLQEPDDDFRDLLELIDGDSALLDPAIRPYLSGQAASLLSGGLQSDSRRVRMESCMYSAAIGSGKDSCSGKIRKPGWRFPPFIFKIRDPEISASGDDFRLSVRPVYGNRVLITGKDFFMQSRGGFSFQAAMGRHVGFYGSLRDNYQKNFVLAQPGWLTREEGGNYKLNEGGRKGGDFSEMRGGIVLSNRWGSISLVKDRVQWGVSRFGSNIFSARTPSFAMISLDLRPADWIRLNYFHGWLHSEEIDSARSYYTVNGDYRASYIPKYIAANMLTVKPLRGISLSTGNSVVYSGMPVQPAFLIPFLFYKSVDHTISHGIDNQNSQVFASLSIRRFSHLHLYANLFVDEFSVKRTGDPDRHNFYSTQAGFSLTDLIVEGWQTGMEWTRSMPLVYKHRVPALSFESNRYQLGHYLTDNAQDLWVWLTVRPVAFISMKAVYNHAVKYNDYPYLKGVAVDQYPAFKDKLWSSESWQLNLAWRWSFLSDIYASIEIYTTRGYEAGGRTAAQNLEQYTAPLYQGKRVLFGFGVNMGI